MNILDRILMSLLPVAVFAAFLLLIQCLAWEMTKTVLDLPRNTPMPGPVDWEAAEMAAQLMREKKGGGVPSER